MSEMKLTIPNVYILTENSTLKLGMEKIISKCFSQYSVPLNDTKIYQISDPERIITAILRNGGSSIVMLDSECCFIHDLILIVDKMKEAKFCFKSALLCNTHGHESLYRVYNSIFDISIDKKSNLLAVEMMLGIIIKSIMDEQLYSGISIDLMPEIFTAFLKLTSRESIVLHDIFKGKTTGDIAKRLFISEKTVHSHRQRIYNKFNVHSLSELYFYIKNSKLI